MVKLHSRDLQKEIPVKLHGWLQIEVFQLLDGLDYGLKEGSDSFIDPTLVLLLIKDGRKVYRKQGDLVRVQKRLVFVK